MGENPSRYSRKFLLWAPLVAMPFMLNLRWQAMVAPNEEPKWAVFVLLGLVLPWRGLFRFFCGAAVSRHTARLATPLD